MKVVGVVGYPASGKGEFSQIAGELGIPVVVMGDMIRRKVVENRLALTDENIGAAARKLRGELGMDAVAILTAEEIEKIDPKIVVIDGIRGDAEVTYFRSVFSDFSLLAISASFETRLLRMKNRGRSDDTTTPETLRSRDEREESFGLARAVSLADAHIENESSREEFVARIRNYLENLA
ncbi:MAG: AAA family ATPase [Methanocorpusculum sp.]|uniref:AAA family ATPase n=1 Tax=Methanocorpusculum sp. TaxID=2058474 RepID=UPI002718249A|nr:AAA family ATPase [Methanocorpusculum sp.]MDO9523423.1 AAA family ATPase [Methanocorpusculum sp.]